jgi:hypothetical protein
MGTRLVKRRKPINHEELVQALHNLQAKGLIEQRPDGRWYAIPGNIKPYTVVPEIPPRMTGDSAQRLRVEIMMAMAQLADRMTDMALWREAESRPVIDRANHLVVRAVNTPNSDHATLRKIHKDMLACFTAGQAVADTIRAAPEEPRTPDMPFRRPAERYIPTPAQADVNDKLFTLVDAMVGVIDESNADDLHLISLVRTTFPGELELQLIALSMTAGYVQGELDQLNGLIGLMNPADYRDRRRSTSPKTPCWLTSSPTGSGSSETIWTRSAWRFARSTARARTPIKTSFTRTRTDDIPGSRKGF